MGGGPGGASTFFSLVGLGPVVFDGKGFVRNNNSWCRNSSLLLIDNSAGVGFSFAKRQ